MNNKINKLDKLFKQAVIEYYLVPHSLRDCMKEFNLKSKYIVQQILKEANIPEHSTEVLKQLQVAKTQENNLLKYGVKSTNSLAETKLKRTITCQAKYGVAYSLQSPEVKAKIQATCLKKYGVYNSAQAEEIKNKIKQTCLEKYGCEYISQDPTWKDTVHNTWINKSDEEKHKSRLKAINTLQIKYGVDAFPQSIKYIKTAHKKYTYNNINFDSSWELALWIYAQDHNENIIREPIKFAYYVDNKKHYYFPDFLYKNNLIEIKGLHLLTVDKKLKRCYTNMDNAIINAKQKCIEENNVIIWTKPDIQFALDYIKITYSKDYLKQFRNRGKFKPGTNKNPVKKMNPAETQEK